MATTPLASRSDVVVVGAGLAGLTAALQLRATGRRVTLIHKGIGGLQLSQGSVDILGYAPQRVERPLEAIPAYVSDKPEHPYAAIPAGAVRRGVQWLVDSVGTDLLVGDVDTNINLPTAVGAVRPTALAMPSMMNGVCTAGARFLIVGPRQFKDFYPKLIAQNLSRTELPAGGRLEARAASIDFAARPGEADASGLAYARSLDDPQQRRRLVGLLRRVVEPGETVGLPAFLGYTDSTAWRDIQDQLGHPVFEIPLPPPGVPGMRLNRALLARAKAKGVAVVAGSFVTSGETDARRVSAIVIEAAGGPRAYAADHVVFAPGGFESGALTMDSYGRITERVFDLPIAGLDPTDLADGWPIHGDYWGQAQPLFRAGVRVDASMRVLDQAGEPVYENLYAVGGLLAGATRWQEKSGEGIALGSAVAAVDAILGTNEGSTR
ncbi:MAG: glycerol-3-phosphate dehydrogenase subunit GlpB [Propionibacterium sp.]|nr:glycerol-3-phosphate dehydrogenase subunit GlpB [Propionibacterium sp.]